MANKSNYSVHGRYGYGGGVVDYGDRIGWWERAILPKSTTDSQITLTNKYQYRPDLVAYDLYGTSSLQWLILQYNNILDINTEFVTGAVLTVPSKARVFTELLIARRSSITKN